MLHYSLYSFILLYALEVLGRLKEVNKNLNFMGLNSEFSSFLILHILSFLKTCIYRKYLKTSPLTFHDNWREIEHSDETVIEESIKEIRKQ